MNAVAAVSESRTRDAALYDWSQQFTSGLTPAAKDLVERVMQELWRKEEQMELLEADLRALDGVLSARVTKWIEGKKEELNCLQRDSEVLKTALIAVLQVFPEPLIS